MGHATMVTQASLENKVRTHYVIEKKEEVGRSGYTQKSIGGQRKFRVAVASHWLSPGWTRRKPSFLLLR